MRHQCQRLAATAPQRPVKPAVPSELRGGLQSKQRLTGALTPGCGGVPCCRLPRSRLTPRRGKRGTGGGGGLAEGQGTGRSLVPAVPPRGSRRGQNPRDAPLACPRGARDPPLPPAPLGGAARPGGGVL